MAKRVKGINHIGIAVRNVEEAKKLYCDILGFEFVEEKTLEERKVKTGFLDAGNTTIELLEGIGEDSPVSKFIARRGEGIHHICFEVDNIAEALEFYEKNGIAAVSKKPEPGAEGKLVSFLHPKGTLGVLLEVMEI